MGSGVCDSDIAAAIDQIAAGFAALHAAGVTPANSRDAITMIQEIEHVRRLADHATIEVMATIDEERFHLGGDGHSSAKAMVRHHARLSNGEAAARERVTRLIDTCPDVGHAYQAGVLGTDHIRSLSLVHANPRIRQLMPGRQAWFLDKAKQRHGDFEAKINLWKRLADQDGPTPKNERAHEDRNARMTQNLDTTWDFVAAFASMQGLQIFEIFDRYFDAETLADWEKARAEHGDHANSSHLPRTVQQRRADAFWQMCNDAATNPNSPVPADFVHNIMWDADTFEAMAQQFFDQDGEPSPPPDPQHPRDDNTDYPGEPAGCNPDAIGCQTIDGIPLDPTELFATAIVGRIRRVLLDAKSAVIDQGVARTFTGSARHAVKLSSTHCVWPGCHAPSSKCESDHLVEHARHGRTNPDNGAPLCGKHNRWKQKGFTIWRDTTGIWHTLRPDGTEIPH